MNRNAKLLSALKDKDSELILELGPLHEPIAKQPEHNVRYVDRMTHKELVEHYTPQGIPVDKIVPLDHVWPPGENLSDHIPGNRFAYCIASHVIEHVPDMVGWLNQLESVMETGSTLSLAIPNQPATFDRKRPCTTTAEVVEAAILESTRPTPKQVYCHATRCSPIRSGCICRRSLLGIQRRKLRTNHQRTAASKTHPLRVDRKQHRRWRVLRKTQACVINTLESAITLRAKSFTLRL